VDGFHGAGGEGAVSRQSVGDPVSRINIGPGAIARADYILRRIAGQVIMRVPLAQTLLRKVAYAINHLTIQADVERDTAKFVRALRESTTSDPRATDLSSGFGYDNELAELGAAVQYRAEAIDPRFAEIKTESYALYEAIEKTMVELLTRERSARSVLNFGVGYMHVDAQLARRFPNVEFLGIDRSMLTQRFNERYFSAIPNLRHLTGDVFDLLKSQRFDGAVLLHARTMVLLPPETIARLYDAARDAGFAYIVGFEQAGISRQTHRWYHFDEQSDTASVVYRGFMFLHNYPRLFKNSGYRLIDADVLKTRHPNPDFRILKLVAARAVN
jgi:hypothetical protein